jgi:hypothetical protein
VEGVEYVCWMAGGGSGGCVGNMCVGGWRVWNMCVGWEGGGGCVEIRVWVCGGCGIFVLDVRERWHVYGIRVVGVWRVWNMCVGCEGVGGMCGKYVCGCVEGVEHLYWMAGSGGMCGKYVCGCVEGVEHLC